jgi:hypothetical protein
VGQELLTLPGHLSPPPDSTGVRVARSFVFSVMSFCPLTIVLSALLRLTASDYSSGRKMSHIKNNSSTFICSCILICHYQQLDVLHVSLKRSCFFSNKI